MAEKETKTKEPEKKEIPKAKKEVKQPSPSVIQSRQLTEEELKMMETDSVPPEGFTKNPPVEITEGEPPKEEKPTEEPPKEEPPKPVETKRDFFERLETEIAKPKGKENLSDFTPREKAYFAQMRRDRDRRQKAEADRDAGIFRENKLKQEIDDLKKPQPEEKDPFEGKTDDDYMTVADVRKMMKTQEAKAKETPKSEPAQEAPPQISQKDLNYLKMCAEKSKQEHEDFDLVMELSGELIDGQAEQLIELKERVGKGESPSEAMYEIIKNHPDFEVLLPAAEVRLKARQPKKAEEPPKKAKEPPAEEPPKAPEKTPEELEKEAKAKAAEDALKNNKNKQRTTAHVGSREGTAPEDLTLEQIAQMPDAEFARLPRKVRDRYLKTLGS